MICDKAIEEYLNSDHLPLLLRLHLSHCKSCRDMTQKLARAQSLLAQEKQQEARRLAADIDVSTILDKLPASSPSRCPVSVGNWVVSGVLMVLLLLSVPFLQSKIADTRLVVAFYLFFAGIITTYCAMFVGCNLDKVDKWLKSSTSKTQRTLP